MAARRFVGRCGLGVLGVGGATACACVVGATVSPGFRRSCQFWGAVTPFVLEHSQIKCLARIQGCDAEELEERLDAFHQRTASRAVEVILRLGGIYVKIGQFASTMGAGILQDAYIAALRPLQDGVPPRLLSEVAAIIEASVGVPMAELFESFDEQPVGAASIAQAHRARLAGSGEEVVVKVQYPEVAELYQADFDNLETVTSWLMPQNVALIQGLRKRHQEELDFRTEAQHLREVAANMQHRGFEPQLVRVPRVIDDRLCTQHVLAMEFLAGVSLSNAIQAEQEAIAQALGMSSAQELRDGLMRSVKEHFSRGGGGTSQLLSDVMGRAMVAAPLLRAYAATRQRLLSLSAAVWNLIARSVAVLTLGALQPVLWAPLRMVGPGVDLGRVLHTLIQVHGTQMLLDGVYNADPHPGNVIVMEDGRLGLIDYGMVGRLGPAERRSIANVVLALARGGEAGKQEVAEMYWEAGYRACWHSGEPHGVDAVHRFATFHLDRIDLSPVRIASTEDPGTSVRRSYLYRQGNMCRTMPIMQLLHSTIENSVPDWIEQARRLGGLLIGVSSQTARPVSLAREWSALAEQALVAHQGHRHETLNPRT